MENIENVKETGEVIMEGAQTVEKVANNVAANGFNPKAVLFGVVATIVVSAACVGVKKLAVKGIEKVKEKKAKVSVSAEPTNPETTE